MATSYNGYTVITSYGDPRLAPLRANGKPFAPLLGTLAGDVEFVMNKLANWLDVNIEPMDPAQSWSFTPKTVTGGSGWSCHASATAFDYNAQKHPQGYKRTHSNVSTWQSWQVQKVDAYLADELDGAVRWGEHYAAPTKDDGMHFELMANPAELRVLVAKLKRLPENPSPIPEKPSPAPTPTPTPGTPAAPTSQEDDMIRLLMVADDPRRYCVDFGARSFWHVGRQDQYDYLRDNIRIPEITDVQAPWILDGFHKIDAA